MTRPKRPFNPASCPGCQVDPQDLGEIKGKLDMIHEAQKTMAQSHGAKLDALDGRMRKVETRSAVFSSGLGAAAGLTMAICVEFVRNALRRS